MRVAIYYKDIPFGLQDKISQDSSFVLTKEGLHSYKNIQCFRAIITLEPGEPNADKSKWDKLIKLLEILTANQEILDFSVSN